MQNMTHRPDFFSELDHPNGIEKYSLDEIFLPESGGFLVQKEMSYTEAEQQYQKALKELETREKNYRECGCIEVVEKKSSLELIGSVAGFVQIMQPAVKEVKWQILMGGLATFISSIASATGNSEGMREALEKCEKIKKDIAPLQNKAAAAKERLDEAMKNMFSAYSVKVQIKKQSETQIRDWKIYAYQLAVYKHALNPSSPKPSAPVYAFSATLVPTERMMRLGANMLAEMVK